jgi:hypothetical protein
MTAPRELGFSKRESAEARVAVKQGRYFSLLVAGACTVGWTTWGT